MPQATFRAPSPLPKHGRDLPEGQHNLPGRLPGLPEHQRRLPGRQRALPEHGSDLREHGRDFPGHGRGLPDARSDLPGHGRDLSLRRCGEYAVRRRSAQRVRRSGAQGARRPALGALAALLLTLMLTTVLAAPASATTAPGRVALIGVPGLEWSDLDESRTPNLWKLVTQGASASMSTRAVPPPDRGITCPVAGWLTVSAGQRAGTPGKGCPPTPAPRPTADGGATVPGWAELSAHQADTGYAAQLGTLGQSVADAGGRTAAIGPGAALAAADKAGNITRYADTPEALPDPSAYTLIVLDAPELADAWSHRPLDQYGVPTAMPAATRHAAVAKADARIGAFLATLPPGFTTLVAGISDVTPSAHLHVAIAAGPSPTGRPYGPGHLTATSTRQDALVTISDLTATAIQLTGAEHPRQVVGRPWQPNGAAATPAETVTGLADADLASQVLREVRGPFFAVFVAVQLLFYAFAALALRRRRTPNLEGHPTQAGHPTPQTDQARTEELGTADQPAHVRETGTAVPLPPGDEAGTAGPLAQGDEAGTADHPAHAEEAGGADHPAPAEEAGGAGRQASPGAPLGGRSAHATGSGLRAAGGIDVASASRLLVAVQVVSVVSGAIAVSTFLAQLVPWWSLGAPMTALIGTILATAALITGLAFAGPWRAHVLGPLTVVAAVTSVAMLVDVMTGSTLQVNAVSGYEPVTGGRFYGFSNIAFAIYATGTILALAGVAQWLNGRGTPRVVVMAVCAAYGGLAVFADGWPSWGADFGGVPAFVVGLAVFLILLSGRRVSVVKLLLVGLAGAVLIGAIAVFDWLRPDSQRTHLGTFVQQIIDGQALTVVARKFGAMVGVTVGNWSLTLLSLVALAFLFLVLNRPSRWGASALGQAYALAPTLRAGLFGALTCALIGFLMNDSGIAIPAMALTVAVPLTLAACVRALQLAAPTTAGPPSGPAAPTASPGRARRS
ncbi:hypothetical protein [Nonomuraea ceibae]|uniref:hypothetical protein n=1 Tax=Nonomuraea ceibae TaxID=1935170 RepID=UPI001FE30B62|nr:hypothetical protein [Nonomuraea ceibae]